MIIQKTSAVIRMQAAGSVFIVRMDFLLNVAPIYADVKLYRDGQAVQRYPNVRTDDADFAENLVRKYLKNNP